MLSTLGEQIVNLQELAMKKMRTKGSGKDTMKQCSRGNILPILGRREDKKKQKGYKGSGGEKHTPEKKHKRG